MKLTKEKTYLRILVNSDVKNMNRHSYIFEQWEGEFLDKKFKFKRDQYSTNNKNEAKIIMGLFGLNKIKRYQLDYYYTGRGNKLRKYLGGCLIEFED